MAKRKKSVKKKKLIEKKIGVDELSGFVVGQEIYCFRHPDGTLAKGEIRILLKTEKYEFAEFVDEITGQFRVTLLKDIIDSPTRSHINSVNSKIATKLRKFKDKK